MVICLAASERGRNDLITVGVYDVGVDGKISRSLVDVDRGLWCKPDHVLDVEGNLRASGVVWAAGGSAIDRNVVNDGIGSVARLVGDDVGVGRGIGLELHKSDIDALAEIPEGVQRIKTVMGRELVGCEVTVVTRCLGGRCTGRRTWCRRVNRDTG